MITGVEIENGSCDPDHAHLGVVCYPNARIWYSLSMYKFWRFLALDVTEMSLEASKFKVGHVTLITPFLR